MYETIMILFLISQNQSAAGNVIKLIKKEKPNLYIWLHGTHKLTTNLSCDTNLRFDSITFESTNLWERIYWIAVCTHVHSGTTCEISVKITILQYVNSPLLLDISTPQKFSSIRNFYMNLNLSVLICKGDKVMTGCTFQSELCSCNHWKE